MDNLEAGSLANIEYVRESEFTYLDFGIVDPCAADKLANSVSPGRGGASWSTISKLAASATHGYRQAVSFNVPMDAAG